MSQQLKLPIIKTLEELRDNDYENCYADYVTVREGFEKGIIPQDYREFIKDKCECGSENIVKKSLTEVTCCNPKCWIKVGYQLADIYKKYSCDGIGKKTCLDISQCMLEHTQYNSVVELMYMHLTPYSYYLQGDRLFKYEVAFNKIKNTTTTYAELMSNLCIPGIDNVMKEILKDYNSTEELTQEIKRFGGVPLFMESKGIHDRKAWFNFRQAIVDFTVAEYYLSDGFIPPAVQEVRICITGTVSLNGSRIKKADYIKLLNLSSIADDGIRLFNIEMNQAMRTNSWVIADYPSNTEKYIAGAERGVIVSAQDFYDTVVSVVKEYNEKQQLDLEVT